VAKTANSERLRPGTGPALLTLRIEGMDCADCAARIEDRLRSLPGVARIAVYFAAGKAAVHYDPAVCQPDDVLKALAALGCRAAPATGVAGERHQPSRLADLIRFAFMGVIALLALALSPDLRRNPDPAFAFPHQPRPTIHPALLRALAPLPG